MLKPDFFDAYLKLGYSLINAGSLDEVRDLISSLREKLPFDPDALVPFKDKTLVFDWNHRRLLDLAWEVERAASSIVFSCFMLLSKWMLFVSSSFSKILILLAR